jgi:DNA-binding GntR family transcriptional regulator
MQNNIIYFNTIVILMPRYSNVDRIYSEIKNMASYFDIKPDEKLNEVRLAEQLGASRTPLREALNRLVSEGFLTFSKGRGFSCRSLTAQQILDLYQSREAVECKLVELACQRSTSENFEKIRDSLVQSENLYQETSKANDLVKLDESFHMAIAELSQNSELIRILNNLNDRVRFIRTIDLEEHRVVTPQNHMDIIDAMIDGHFNDAVNRMQAHIVRSSEEATDAVRKAYARIYVPDLAIQGVS